MKILRSGGGLVVRLENYARSEVDFKLREKLSHSFDVFDFKAICSWKLEQQEVECGWREPIYEKDFNYEARGKPKNCSRFKQRLSEGVKVIKHLPESFRSVTKFHNTFCALAAPRRKSISEGAQTFARGHKPEWDKKRFGCLNI